MKIFIADDHQVIVDDIIDELSKLCPNAMCIGTSDPEQILTIFKEYEFDVIFMDIDLSGYNGISLAKKILEIKPRTNIIYITGYEKFALESYETCASAFLVKPINTEMISKALDTLRYPVSNVTDAMLHSQYMGKNLIGARLMQCREERGMSVQELAGELGVAVQTIYRWERGERVPDVITFMHIAKVLGVNVERIMCF